MIVIGGNGGGPSEGGGIVEGTVMVGTVVEVVGGTAVVVAGAVVVARHRKVIVTAHPRIPGDDDLAIRLDGNRTAAVGGADVGEDLPVRGEPGVEVAGRGLRRRNSADEQNQGGERCDPSPDAPPRAVPRVHVRRT